MEVISNQRSEIRSKKQEGLPFRLVPRSSSEVGSPVRRRVAVGISGGVDSAVAAALLKKQGYEVIGVHLYCYDEGPYCTAPEDRKMAVRVAKHLGIPLQVWDLRKEYKELVIRYFFDEYKKGRTPNPDIVCNREIKFGIFLEKALKELKVDYIATGHYARIKKDRRGYHLLRGVDEGKDQSYFLYSSFSSLPKQLVPPSRRSGASRSTRVAIFDRVQECPTLEHILFPIGDYRKSKVRELAKKFGLPNYSRRDSMGVCFIGPVPIAKFLREHLPSKHGPVVNTRGEIIGEHDGVWFFTEGQRHGFKIFRSPGLPLYVVGKDVSTNTLVVGRGEDTKVRQFVVEKPHWIDELGDRIKMRVGLRIRHLGELLPAVISSADNKPLAISHKLLATLAEPAFGVAPGQSAVLYKRDEVLGGGVIQSAKPVVSGGHH